MYPWEMLVNLLNKQMPPTLIFFLTIEIYFLGKQTTSKIVSEFQGFCSSFHCPNYFLAHPKSLLRSHWIHLQGHCLYRHLCDLSTYVTNTDLSVRTLFWSYPFVLHKNLRYQRQIVIHSKSSKLPPRTYCFIKFPNMLLFVQSSNKRIKELMCIIFATIFSRVSRPDEVR